MTRNYQGSRRLLLCVDDSPAILEYVRRIFEESGYIVVTTASARQGLSLATRFSFDAVLLDYHMPEMNGHELAYEIRRFRPTTPVIMLSGAEIPFETRQLVDAVVSKNEARGKLLTTVIQLCDRPSPF